MIPQLTAEEITRRVQAIDSHVTVIYEPHLGWLWTRYCPKHLKRPGDPDARGQQLGETYEQMIDRLLRMYGHAGLNLQSQSHPVETERRNYQAERWHEAVGIVSDIIALGIYRHYLTHPQAVDLMNLQKQLRNLVKRYEQDEREAI